MLGKSKASDLLTRASSQLRGERPALNRSASIEEDEIAAYISSLNKKTGTNIEKKYADIRSDSSDVSISNEDKNNHLSKSASTPNKWLKKKKTAHINESTTYKKPDYHEPPSTMQHSGPKLSALKKAESFANKFKQKKQTFKPQLSDSDLSMNISIDSDIVNEIEGVNKKMRDHVKSSSKNEVKTSPIVKVPSGSAGKPTHSQSSAMRYSKQKISDEDSLSIGKKSIKFLKKKHATSQSTINDKKSQNLLESPTGPRKHLRFDLSLSSDVSEKHPKEPSIASSTPRKPALKKTHHFRSSSMTEDEVQNVISSSSSFENSPHKPLGMELGGESGTYLKIPETDLSQSSDGSYRDSDQDSILTDINVNLMDIENLEPAVTETKPNIKLAKKKIKDSSGVAVSSFLESIGLQTIDDILGPRLSENENVIPESPPPNKKTTNNRVDSEHKKPDDFFGSLGLQTLDDLEPAPVLFKQGIVDLDISEESEIATETESEINRYESDFESEKRSKVSSIPEVPSGRSFPYSEDFEETSASDIKTSDSETDTESTIKTAPSKESQDSVSERETDISTSQTISESSSIGSRSETDTEQSSITESSLSHHRIKRKVKVTSVEVQTLTSESSFHYQWDTRNIGLSSLGRGYGLDYVDPSPIACHVISPDAIEAMTAYSPSIIALNDMLKQQLALTQQFVSSQRRLYNSIVASVEPTHCYTTLEDTKEYIRKNRKPKLTFEEALQMVEAEMS